MDGIERVLWVAVAVVFGNLGGTAYQMYVAPKPKPVKYEQKGTVRKAAEVPDGYTAISCVSKEVGQAVLDAYKENQETGELTLTLFLLLGACEIADETQPINKGGESI